MITVNDMLPTIQQFPNGETNVVLSPTSIRTEGGNTLVWTYEGDFEFMQLQQIVAVLKQHQATDITVHIPYFPYERMDRVDPEVHNAMTMKLAFNMIPKDVDYEIYEQHSAKLAETVALN